jgi:hypothetical protein
LKNKIIILSTLILLLLSINAKDINIFEIINDYNGLQMEIGDPLPPTKSISTKSVDNMLKGEELFIKKLQRYCQMSGGRFALTYSQDEWEAIAEAGKFNDITLEICPKLEDRYREQWTPNLYQFAYMYAKDSGNIPSS